MLIDMKKMAWDAHLRGSTRCGRMMTRMGRYTGRREGDEKRKKENVQWPPHGQENVEKSVVAWPDNYAIADG
jgi:hypothetical protein